MLAGIGIGLVGWIAGQFSTELWNALSALTLSVVEAMLRPFAAGIGVDHANMTLLLDDFEVHISRECSGLEGVGLIAVLLAAYLVAFRERLRMPNALLLIPLGVGAVWLGNALRIAVLMVIGARVDADLAYGGFHSKLGWVLFCMAAWRPWSRPPSPGSSGIATSCSSTSAEPVARIR
jgi:exosortase/archaeosortase family protein